MTNNKERLINTFKIKAFIALLALIVPIILLSLNTNKVSALTEHNVTITHNGKVAGGHDGANGVGGMYVGTDYYFRFLATGGFSGYEWKFSIAEGRKYTTKDKFELTIDTNHFNTLVAKRKRYNESSWTEYKISFNQSLKITAYGIGETGSEVVVVEFEGEVVTYVANDNAQDAIAEFYLTYEIDDYAPVFTGETAVISNVDSPLTLDQIKAGIKAIDDVDGDITHKIQVVSDDYTANKNKLGTYDVKLSVSDEAGNTSNLTVKVSVVDIVAPTLTIKTADGGTTNNPVLTIDEDYEYEGLQVFGLTWTEFASASEMVIGEPIQAESALMIVLNFYALGIDSANSEDQVIFSDNYENSFNGYHFYNLANTALKKQTLLIEEDGIYGIPLFTYGTYVTKFRVKDSSNNKSELYTITLNIVDGKAPVISGQNRYEATKSNQLTIAAIKAGLQAHDNKDGDITSKITVKTDNYTPNFQQLGEHSIIFEVKDEAGNIATHEVIVTVNHTDEQPPIFHVNDAFITVTESLNWTQDQIIAHLIRIGQLPDNVTEDYTVTATNYMSQAPVGDYQVVFTRKEEANTDLKEIITVGIKVTADQDPIPGDNQPPTDVDKDDSDSFGVKIENFFKDYGAYVVIGFIGLIVVLVVIKAINPSGRKRW